jgi:uncharacterized protein (UPF0335 family)
MSKEQVERYMKIEEKLKDVSTRKIRVEEQYKAKKNDLKDLIEEIKKEGYNPNELKSVIEGLEKEFNDELEVFEKTLEEISGKLSKIEG